MKNNTIITILFQVFNEVTHDGKPIPNKFACIEHWESVEADQAHVLEEHVKVFAKKMAAADLYVKPMDIN